jgi:hypothetical protein
VPHCLARPHTGDPKGTLAATLFAVYPHPADPAAFDACRFSKHVPPAKTQPDLKSHEVTRGDVMMGETARVQGPDPPGGRLLRGRQPAVDVDDLPGDEG